MASRTGPSSRIQPDVMRSAQSATPCPKLLIGRTQLEATAVFYIAPDLILSTFPR